MNTYNSERVSDLGEVLSQIRDLADLVGLELELIQYQMTQKPMLRCGGEGAPVRAANKPRSQEKEGRVCVVSHCL